MSEYLDYEGLEQYHNKVKAAIDNKADVDHEHNEYVKEEDIFEDPIPEGYVDLGLPSGKLWASCNLGASTDAECGDYYMWGSTTPNTDTRCDWIHAPFNGGLDRFDEIYFNEYKDEWLDGEVLKPEYDAVYQATGGKAHMPTKEDFEELIANTTKTFETAGVTYTSKSDPTKSIFIPLTNYRLDSGISVTANIVSLWSSSINTSNYSKAYRLQAGMITNRINNDFTRMHGLCLRGVCNSPSGGGKKIKPELLEDYSTKESLATVNTLANNAYSLADSKLSTDLSNINDDGEAKIKELAGIDNIFDTFTENGALGVSLHHTTDRFKNTTNGNAGISAFGYANNAEGYGTFVSGSFNNAVGARSFASGRNNYNKGANTLTTGYFTTAAGDSSSSLNAASETIGNASFAVGNGIRKEFIVTGSNLTYTYLQFDENDAKIIPIGTRIGLKSDLKVTAFITNVVNNGDGTATITVDRTLGELTEEQVLVPGTIAVGEAAIALNGIAEGYRSFSVGHNSYAKGSNSISIGDTTTANNNYEVALGYCNNSIVSENIAEATAFSIGDGTVDFRHNLIEVKKNGDFYINGSYAPIGLIGNVSDLETLDKSTLVAAINELVARVSALEEKLAKPTYDEANTSINMANGQYNVEDRSISANLFYNTLDQSLTNH